MLRDNSSTSLQAGTESPQTLYRGLYVRIARRLGVDPSYVSRVARGDRRSSQIESALHQELDKINQRLRHGSSARASKRLQILMKQNRGHIRNQWLLHSQADSNLRKIRLATQKRTAPILPVVEEAIRTMTLSLKEMASAPMRAAEQHGRLRQAQGFTAMALVEEYNLVRRCVFALAQEHFEHMDPRLLIQDLTQFGEALDLQTQRALQDYLAAA
jgi:hypothetical protein